jgi:hypothetical protein
MFCHLRDLPSGHVVRPEAKNLKGASLVFDMPIMASIRQAYVGLQGTNIGYLSVMRRKCFVSLYSK